MTRKGKVYQNGIFAGIIEKKEFEYIFYYDENFLKDKNLKPISLNFPKTRKKFRSKYLFPFFYGLLAEGALQEIQCRKFKIDVNDHFSRLLKTTKFDTIGNVTIEEINE